MNLISCSILNQYLFNIIIYGYVENVIYMTILGL